jgi:cobalamin synthase
VRYLGLAAFAVFVWVLLVVSELLGKSLDATRSGTISSGAHLFPAPVLIAWALVSIAYVVDSRGSSRGPVSYVAFWVVAVLLSAFALYAAWWCICSLVGLRALRRHRVQ